MNDKLKFFLLIIAFILGIPILLMATYEFILFALLDFNPDYKEIDRCMDNGHGWNYERAECYEGRN